MEEEEVRNRRFNEILETMADTFRRKNHDYGNAFHDVFRKRGWNYALGLMENKINRIDVLSGNDPMVSGEGIEDSLLDLANYAILTLLEIREPNDTEIINHRIEGYPPGHGFFTEGKV